MAGDNLMSAFYKKIIISIIERSRIGIKYLNLYRFRNHLTEIGWFKSCEKGLPVDADGKPLPWYTYAAIKYLSMKVKSEMRIFEYGTGNSTLWWSERVSFVTSIEHDLPWFERMKGKVPANVDYRYCELVYKGRYCKIILEYENHFDIIIIDGRDRVNCLRNSLRALKTKGIIILDNSDRDEYRDGYQFLLESGFKRLDFYGYGPMSLVGSCTSLFYRNENCLGI